MKAKIWNYSAWIAETNKETLKKTFDALLLKAGFSVLSSTEHNFNPYGYTCLWLLAESHFACHTFPEEKRTYIELASCNQEYYKRFLETINNECDILFEEV